MYVVTVWYDTHCNVCQKYRKFIEKHDKHNVTHFKSIYEHESYIPDSIAGTILTEVRGVQFEKSDAVLKHWALLGGIVGVYGKVGLFIPKSVRDWMYTLIAKHRYRLLGRCN